MPETAAPDAAEPDGRAFVRQHLDLSTAHVTQEVMDGIEKLPGVVAYANTYGAWLWVPQHVEEHVSDNDGDIPQCIIDIWLLARSLDCNFAHLDCDAETCPALAVYVW